VKERLRSVVQVRVGVPDVKQAGIFIQQATDGIEVAGLDRWEDPLRC
jgi:hypothetical protein